MRSAQYRVVHKLKDRYSVVAMCAYFGFPRSSYYLWLKNGKPDYKAFDWNLADTLQHLSKSSLRAIAIIGGNSNAKKISIIIQKPFIVI